MSDLPEVPGFYVRADTDLNTPDPDIYIRDSVGNWAFSGGENPLVWIDIHNLEVPRDLVRLVKESD